MLGEPSHYTNKRFQYRIMDNKVLKAPGTIKLECGNFPWRINTSEGLIITLWRKHQNYN